MKINTQLVDIYSKDIIKESELMSYWISYFNNMTSRPISYYFSDQDVKYCMDMALSPNMATHPKERNYNLDTLMQNRGFKLVAGGTNRRFYSHATDNIGIKVGTDKVGFVATMKEIYNQNVLKPFCTKIFDVSQYGVLGMSELFVPFKTEAEFAQFKESVHEILFFKIRQNNIGMEDIGLRSFKNWGVRPNFGPGLLDFPTMYVLDPRKRYCDRIVNGHVCGSSMDYDEGYDIIRCNTCKTTYHPRDLALDNGEDLELLLQAVGYKPKTSTKECSSMKFVTYNAETGEITSVRGSNQKSTGFIDPSSKKRYHRPKPVINLNQPQPEQKRKPIKFSLIEDGKVGTPAPQSEPEQKQKVKIDDTDPTINEILSEDYKVDYSHLENSFDRYYLEFAKTYEVDQNQSEQGKLIDLLLAHSSAAVPSAINEARLNVMYRNLFTATVEEDMTIDDYTISTSQCVSSMFTRRLLQEIPTAGTSGYGAFKLLVSSVSNAVNFFESIAATFKIMLTNFSYEIDEIPGGIVSYKIDKGVWELYRNTLRRVINDYFLNIKFSGTLTYNPANAYRLLRDSLSKLHDKFDNAENKTFVRYVMCGQTTKVYMNWEGEEEDDIDEEEALDQSAEQEEETEAVPETPEESDNSHDNSGVPGSDEDTDNGSNMVSDNGSNTGESVSDDDASETADNMTGTPLKEEWYSSVYTEPAKPMSKKQKNKYKDKKKH